MTPWLFFLQNIKSRCKRLLEDSNSGVFVASLKMMFKQFWYNDSLIILPAEYQITLQKVALGVGLIFRRIRGFVENDLRTVLIWWLPVYRSCWISNHVAKACLKCWIQLQPFSWLRWKWCSNSSDIMTPWLSFLLNIKSHWLQKVAWGVGFNFRRFRGFVENDVQTVLI